MEGKHTDYRIERVAGTVQLTHISTALVTRVAADARVRFSDYTLRMDVDGNAGKAYRLYQAAFNRTPDIRGLGYWIEAMDSGNSLNSIAQGFATSTEFKSVYGISPTNADIIDRFYENVLHRDGEPDGVYFWTNVLNNKWATVAEVLAGFSESPENQQGVFAVIGNGIAYRETGVQYVTVANAGSALGTSVGSPVTLDGSESIGSANLTYNWSVTSRPAGSTAQLLNATTAFPSFTPDKVGDFVLTLSVSDGQTSASATTTVNVMPPSLNFAPLDARFSRATDKVVTVSSNPNALTILDPFSESIRTVSLPTAVKSYSLSPDGKLAIVLHESVASLVDLEAGTLVKSFATGGSHTDAFVTNDAVAYFIGQTGGQWVRPAVMYFNARTGAELTKPESETGYLGMLYGTQYGIYAPSKNRVFLMEQGLSPADIHYFTIDPANNGVFTIADSPYHGDYTMAVPLFLSETEDLLYTSSGNYFYTSDLRYAGKFSLERPIISLSNSIAKDETVVLTGPVSTYPGVQATYEASYYRFTGPLQFPAGSVSFPMIGGKQSYGIKIWHSSTGRRLALVQVGTAVQSGSGAKYYVVVL